MTLEHEIELARQKVITDGYDMSIGELMSQYRDGEIDINPAFQRLYRWEIGQKTRFIESLLLGIPTPPIFVYTKDDSKWELVDGLQRLSTIFEFAKILRNRHNTDPEQPLRLEGTKLLPSLNGKAWADSAPGKGDGLTLGQQLDIKRVRIRVEILKKGSNEQAKYELFLRLNTGGSPLSEQEVRDCVLVMVDRTYYEWLKELTVGDDFLTTIALSDNDKEQQRPTELLLRLLGYLSVPYTSGLDIHDYLDNAAIELAKSKESKRQQDKAKVKEVFKFLAESVGGDAFKKWNGTKFTGSFSIAAYEVITIGIAQNLPAIGAMAEEERRQFLREHIQAIWTDRKFAENSGAGVRGTKRWSNLLPQAGNYFVK